MSIHFVITPYQPSTWETASSDLRIDPVEFQKRLLEAWPDADVKLSSKGRVRWTIPEKGSSGFYGSLHPNHQIVTFNPGNWITFKDFVLWYRRLVPDEYELHFFNTSSWDSLIITSSTTLDDIEEFI
jgi:hypothetical protein